MRIGIISGSLSLAILFGLEPHSLPLLLLAAAVAANHFVATTLTPLFPGTAWSDPEFAVGQPRPLGFAPQQLICHGICTLVLIAVAFAVLNR